MCYAALTKGFTALATELLVAAQLLGVNDELAKELADSQAQHHATMARQIPRMPSVAHRWIGEMEEIAKTFAELGLTPRILEGAADLYRFAASTAVGAERPETRDMRRGLDETIEALARAAEEPAGTRWTRPTRTCARPGKAAKATARGSPVRSRSSRPSRVTR